MSKGETKLFIKDMLDAIEKIERYTQEIRPIEEFILNEMVSDAVIRNLEIIGEAAKNLPDQIYQKYSDIPWKNIVGLRNVVTHGYFVVDLEIIWKIIKEQIPPLKENFKTILVEI